jgi:uncharacterized membrane protein YfhO
MGPVNETAWRMLNVKYIITGSPVPLNQFPYLKLISAGGNTFIYENRNVLPRVYFVNKAEQKTALEILNLIKQNSFDPREIVYIEDQYLKVSTIDSTSYAEITRYSDEDIELNVNAAGNNFLFAGNTFTKGWKAFIDGNETKIYKANHGFLGLVVPNGKHKILITFSPDSFYMSRIVVLILSSLVMLGLLLVMFKYLSDKRKIKNAQ